MLLIGCATMLTHDQLQNQIVINFPNLKKQQIYERSLQFLAHTFQSAKAVLEYKNLGEGKIIGNIVCIHYWASGTVYFKYSLTIDTKDFRSRFTLSANPYYDLHALIGKGGPFTMPFDSGCLPDIQADFEMLKSSYEKYINNPPTGTTSW